MLDERRSEAGPRTPWEGQLAADSRAVLRLLKEHWAAGDNMSIAEVVMAAEISRPRAQAALACGISFGTVGVTSDQPGRARFFPRPDAAREPLTDPFDAKRSPNESNSVTDQSTATNTPNSR